jgi:putative ABC transport system substrate-binding protein
LAIVKRGALAAQFRTIQILRKDLPAVIWHFANGITGNFVADALLRGSPMRDMRRREVIALLGGAAVTWPIVLHAEARKIPKIGVLWHAGSEQEEIVYLTALRQGFRDIGHIEGKTFTLENRFPNEQPERMFSMAKELAALPVDVLIAVTALSALAAQRATTTIPIVFVVVPDPVAIKLVNSLARPGGNITGTSHITVELSARRLEMLKEAVSGLSRVALLVNLNDQLMTPRYIAESQAAASVLGITVQPVGVRALADFERAFDESSGAGLQGVSVSANGLFFQGREVMAQMALKHRLPLIAYSKETFDAGALLSYGSDQIPMFQRTAVYVDKILKGQKPAELPVELPTRFQFRINLKVANALGITIPSFLLTHADEVTE